ncbi:hypothetical protein [Desulforamulus ruminis]|uniref:Uncharacterized protein n=1 Tax=Desulforamulus ruminis (strain ATCC 23193 / DSM 2154 / NCIMB 8452 / DL) TaxID=696281 RepID=F6DQ11_DESRL|nr:hypothetical protein [Desulforamulus ruminis]AEG61955.1 hypothetical protein Desru_3755 [Desulforamulus ruminis DSM 2154]
MKKRLINMLIVLLIAGLLPGVAFATSFGTIPNEMLKVTSKDGIIWAIRETGNPNYYWNGSSWVSGNTSLSGPYGSAYENKFDIFIDDMGRLWFSGVRTNDNEYSTGYFQMTAGGKTVSDYGYRYFVKANDGTVWTWGYPSRDVKNTPTVAYFNGEGFTNLPVKAPFYLSGPCLTIDHDGRPWVCGSGQGDYNKVAYWNGSSWVRCDPPFPNGNMIGGLTTTEDGSIMAFADYSYGYGWALYKNGVWTIKNFSKDDRSANPVKTYANIELGPGGKIWGISNTDGTKLAYYDEGIWKITMPAPFGISDFTVDSSGIVWAINGKQAAAYIEGAWLTDTDGFSSKLIEAAKKSADAAKVSADAAAANTGAAVTAAQGAKASADTAASRAQTAVNQTVDAGTSAASWAHQSYDKANQASQDATYIRNTQLPSLETKLNNLQVSVTNIQNSDTMPPTVEIQTVSGARATSGSSIQAIVTVTDNRPGPYTYSINGGSYSTLPDDGRITLPVYSSGNNSITVSVQDAAGNVGSKTIVIRKF